MHLEHIWPLDFVHKLLPKNPGCATFVNRSLQVYVWRDRDLLRDVLDQAKKGGFQSLALTVDFSW